MFTGKFMLKLSGFVFSEQPYYIGETSLVYRGAKEPDGRSVVVKILKDPHPSQEQKARFIREFEILSQLPANCTVVSYDLQPYHDSLLFIMDTFGTHTLQQVSEQFSFSVPDVLAILLKIADSLEII